MYIFYLQLKQFCSGVGMQLFIEWLDPIPGVLHLLDKSVWLIVNHFQLCSILVAIQSKKGTGSGQKLGFYHSEIYQTCNLSDCAKSGII